MWKLLVKGEQGDGEELPGFFFCWVKQGSTFFNLWESLFAVAWVLNFIFAAISISFRHMLVIGGSSVWYTTQGIFLLDIFYNLVTERVNERGAMTRHVKDSARVYLYRRGFVDLLALFSIVVTFHGDMFAQWEQATNEVQRAVANDESLRPAPEKLEYAVANNPYIQWVRWGLLASLLRLTWISRVLGTEERAAGRLN